MHATPKQKAINTHMATNQAGWANNDSFDWDSVSEDAPPPLEAGIYGFQIAQAEPEQTKKGDPGVKLVLTITHAMGGSAGDMKRKVYDKLTLTKEALFRTKQLAKALDVQPPPGNAPDHVEAFAQALSESGAGFVRLKQETYQGKVNARVDRYLTSDQAQEAAAGSAPAGDAGAAPAARKRRS
jgi:hypothetical protein